MPNTEGQREQSKLTTQSCLATVLKKQLNSIILSAYLYQALCQFMSIEMRELKDEQDIEP